jgi:hypothetical protein
MIMKTSALFILLVITSFSVSGQSGDSMVFGKALARYKRMEVSGMALTAIGAMTLFTGNILYWKVYNNAENKDPDDKAKKYGQVMIGGLGIMVAGIPLMAIGKSKKRHIQIEARLVTFKGFASANGIGLNVRF